MIFSLCQVQPQQPSAEDPSKYAAASSPQRPQQLSPQLQPQPEQFQQQQQQIPQQPLKQTRTGNQSVTDKFSDLNNLLASGTGLDTFGNTGQTRIPAQHTKTGTFINSQGTGYKQVSNMPQGKHNPFLGQQYTGLPSTSVVPSYTGYGFGNQNVQKQTSQNRANGADQGVSLIDL